MNELLVFAKAPRPGLVKTRLAKHLGEEGALQAYRRLLTAVARKVGDIQNATTYFSPADAENELRPIFPSHWRFRAQEGDDLGDRLINALAASFAAGSQRVTVIGADCPYLTSADIVAAWEALEYQDVVLGPAKDGGYWLIALKKLHRELFSGIAWGTESVLEQTVARAERSALKIGLLRTLSDVDTMLEWQKFLGGADLFQR